LLVVKGEGRGGGVLPVEERTSTDHMKVGREKSEHHFKLPMQTIICGPFYLISHPNHKL